MPTKAETNAQHALEAERRAVGHRYARLDQLREEKTEQLKKVRSSGAIGSRQNQSRRSRATSAGSA